METASHVCRRYVRHDFTVFANFEMTIALTKIAVNVDFQFQTVSSASDLPDAILD